MGWMDRTASRWILAALGFAAWCAGSVWGLLELTRSYPGIISMKPGRGAFELSEAAFHMPAEKALVILFLCAFLVVMIVGGLRRLLDPDRLALDAVVWVLRSKTLWLALGIVTVAALLGIWIPGAWWNGMDAGIEISAFIAAILIPFAAWNARTLQRQELSAWWQPRWPGWQAVLLVFVVMAISFATQAGIFVMPRLIGPMPAFAVVGTLDEIVSFLGWLLVAIAWIERASIATGWRSFLGVLRWRRLRSLLWQALLFAVASALVLIPMLMGAILVIYVIPQYGEFAKTGGIPLSWPLHALVQLARRFQALGLLPAVVVMLQSSLAQGRLLVLLGASDSANSRK